MAFFSFRDIEEGVFIRSCAQFILSKIWWSYKQTYNPRKIILESANIQRTDFVFGLFLKLKKIMVRR